MLDYREHFKKSLRKYDQQRSTVYPPRPVSTNIYGRGSEMPSKRPMSVRHDAVKVKHELRDNDKLKEEKSKLYTTFQIPEPDVLLAT